MENNNQKVRIAVVQAASVIMDSEACLKKALKLTEEAAKTGAQIVVFPESFIPAYPRGLSFGYVVGRRTEEGRKDWLRYYENSVAIPGPITDKLGEAAKKYGIYLTIGVTEKDSQELHCSLFCTNIFFGPDGRILGIHRKLKPTGSERIIWGEGDGSTLTVLDTPYGKMGALMCWENYMPLARAAMYAKGVKIYLAPTADYRDEWQCTMRHIALEGRCFVIGCNQYIEKSMYPKDLSYYSDIEKLPDVVCSGGSCIVSPFGKYIIEPVFNKEDILVADLDMTQIIQSRMEFDVTGHYARNDVFKLIVNE